MAEEYRANGYAVQIRPSRDQRPAFLHDYDADLIAVSAKDRVIVEVVSHSSSAADVRVKEIASRLEAEPGWRFELVVANPLEPELLTLDLDEASLRLEEARKLLDAKHEDAALLLAWSGIEAVLRCLATARAIEVRPPSHLALLRALRTGGELSQTEHRYLSDAVKARNEVAHGFKPLNRRLTMLTRNLLDVGRALTDRLRAPQPTDQDVTVDELIEWFHDHYEDPAQHVPHDSGEGGYQYYAGGPYDAAEELADNFPDVNEALIEEAVRIIEADGTEWVRKGDY